MTVNPCALCWAFTHFGEDELQDDEACALCRDFRDAGYACGPEFMLDTQAYVKLRARLREDTRRADREDAAYHADQDRRCEEGDA